MRPAVGAQSEVVASLAIIMVTATTLLTALFLSTHSRQLDHIQGLLGRALVSEATRPSFFVGGLGDDVEWWTVSRKGEVRRRSVQAGVIDERCLELAATARSRGSSMLRRGPPWEPIRFAVPLAMDGSVAVARIPSVLSGTTLLLLLVVDTLVFVAFGGYLLRRRIVLPMLQLAEAARAIGERGPGTRVVVDGAKEARQVAWAFNEMSRALEERTHALEKAVAELRETNAQLHQARAGLVRAERLAAVGSLAAGVAHEVGNPMGALLAFLELAGRDEGLGETGRAHLRRAADQGARVKEILRQLLDFSRPPQATQTMVDLERVGEQVRTLVHAQRRYEHIDFDLVRAEGVMAVRSDESMISQILLNLVLNAADAVRDQTDARIRLTIRPAGEGRKASSTAAKAGGGEGGVPGAMECEVADNGPGLSASDRSRVFDPFFTTKPPGEGTGLGLANAQRLGEELGGAVEYRDDVGIGGATFVLELPVAGTNPDAPETGLNPGCRTP